MDSRLFLITPLASAADQTMFAGTSAPIVRARTGRRMMKGTLAITIATLLMANSASAQVPAGTPLAMGLATGMTKEEAKAVLPKMGNIPVIEGCNGTVAPVYKNNRLAFVRVNSVNGRKERQCDDVVIAALRAKYGEPEIGDGANDCDFYGGCALSGLSNAFKSPSARLTEQADAVNGKRYYRFKTASVVVDVRQDVANRWVNLIYRPNVAATVTAEDASKL